MKLILIFLCFLSLYGCGDSVAKSRHVYRINDSELQFILNSIGDRLDKLEGSRDNPSFSGKLTSGTIPIGRAIRVYAEDSTTNSTLTVFVGSVEPGDYILVFLNGTLTLSP